jgi:hypothetical protein
MSNGHHNLRPVDPQRAAEAAAATERARQRAEIEALRIEMEERDKAVVRGLTEAMIEHLNEIVDDVDRFVKRTIGELYDKVDQLWHGQTERLGGLEVDHQLVLGRRLYGQVGRFLALEDAVNVRGRAPVGSIVSGP